MTAEELKEMIEGAIKEATKTLTEENKKFIEDMEKQLEELKKPAEEVKTPGAETVDPTGGFINFADFAQKVAIAEKSHGRTIDKRLLALEAKAAGDGQTVGTDSEGGFLIPTEYRNQLLKRSTEKSNLMSKCMNIPMSVSTVKMPYVKETDRSSGYIHGSIMLYWVGEEAQKTESKMKFGQITLTLHELAGLAYTSNQILDESPISMEPLLNEAFTDAFAWTMDNMLLEGTGAAQPLGIKNAPCLVGITKETGQAADTILYENIVKMEARLLPESEGKAIYLANKNTFPQLATMTFPAGTAGVPVYLPAGGASGKPYKTLMGRPLIFMEHCRTVGDKGDIYLADFSQYLLGQKKGKGIQAASSIHLKFDYDQTAFRFIFQVDGQPWLPSAITPRYSSDTLSSFITLNART